MSLESYTVHFKKQYMRRENTDKTAEVHPDITFIMTYSHAAWLTFRSLQTIKTGAIQEHLQQYEDYLEAKWLKVSGKKQIWSNKRDMGPKWCN